jgi:hypothetical protein
MITDENNFWIKIEPIKRESEPSNLYILINNEEFNYEIYNKIGLESLKIYFQGKNFETSFFLKTKSKNFRIDFGNNGIKFIPISIIQNISIYIKNHCNCKSSQASCWANAIYYTSKSEKSPFNEM